MSFSHISYDRSYSSKPESCFPLVTSLMLLHLSIKLQSLLHTIYCNTFFFWLWVLPALWSTMICVLYIISQCSTFINYSLPSLSSWHHSGSEGMSLTHRIANTATTNSVRERSNTTIPVLSFLTGLVWLLSVMYTVSCCNAAFMSLYPLCTWDDSAIEHFSVKWWCRFAKKNKTNKNKLDRHFFFTGTTLQIVISRRVKDEQNLASGSVTLSPRALVNHRRENICK